MLSEMTVRQTGTTQRGVVSVGEGGAAWPQISGLARVPQRLRVGGATVLWTRKGKTGPMGGRRTDGEAHPLEVCVDQELGCMSPKLRRGSRKAP